MVAVELIGMLAGLVVAVVAVYIGVEPCRKRSN